MRIRARSRVGALPVCLLTLALASSASAQTPGPAGAAPPAGTSRDEVARNLFERGKLKWQQKAYAEAAALFAASHEQAAKAGPLALLADCHEQLGRLRSARDAFQLAADLALRSDNLDLAFRARTRAAALEPRIPRVEIRAQGPAAPGLLVTLNGMELPGTALGAPLALDAGAYRLEARAPGYEPFTVPFSVSNEIARAQSVRVIPVELTPLSKPLGQRELAYWIGGAGGAAVLATIVVSVVAKQKDASGHEAEAQRLARGWGNVLGFGSVALLGTAATLYLTADSPPEASALGVRWHGEF